MAERRHDCEHCPQHEVNTLKIAQNCEKLKAMHGEMIAVRKEMGDFKIAQNTVINNQGTMKESIAGLKKPLVLLGSAAAMWFLTLLLKAIPLLSVTK